MSSPSRCGNFFCVFFGYSDQFSALFTRNAAGSARLITYEFVHWIVALHYPHEPHYKRRNDSILPFQLACDFTSLINESATLSAGFSNPIFFCSNWVTSRVNAPLSCAIQHVLLLVAGIMNRNHANHLWIVLAAAEAAGMKKCFLTHGVNACNSSFCFWWMHHVPCPVWRFWVFCIKQRWKFVSNRARIDHTCYCIDWPTL